MLQEQLISSRKTLLMMQVKINQLMLHLIKPTMEPLLLSIITEKLLEKRKQMIIP